MQNYSLRDAFKSLDELNEAFIETSIVVNGPLSDDFVEEVSTDESKEELTEEKFSLSDEEGLKDIEEFKEESENEEPELTIVDTNADKIDEVASNEDAAGSFVFTCDKCGENIFRTLDELKTDGYERVDDTLFKLKNKDESQGEFYHCTKCGNDTFTGNKQLVLADVDAEVEGKPEEVINSETDINVVDETSSEPDVISDEADIVVEESLEKEELKEAAEFTEDDIETDYISDKIALLLDEAGITYGEVVDYGKSCNIVGVPEEEWEEAQSLISSELGLRCEIPDSDHLPYDDELTVYDECLKENFSADKLAEFQKHDLFKDFSSNTIRKFINIYLDFMFMSKKEAESVTPEDVAEFMTEEGLGIFALDNIEALSFLNFKELAKKDPKLLKACVKFFPEASEEGDPEEIIEATFKGFDGAELEDIIDQVKKIYLELDESLEEAEKKPVKEGFKKRVNGQTFWSVDGEEWEECTPEEFEECGYEEVVEEEYDDVTITEINESSIDKAISEKLSAIYENFGSYKTTSAFLKDVSNRIILEGKLTFTSNKEQDVKFILEALESDNGSIKFKLTCEDFEDINSELMTKLTEGLLEADESSEEDIVVNTPKAEIITVTSADELKDLYKKWAMTWEGLSEESFDQAVDMCGGENAKGYLISGKLMNDVCHLSGDNAYPEDLNIFAVYPFKGLAVNYGARWMADIIDNNARREGFHPFMDEQLDEASSAEKRAFLNGGKDADDYIQGKAIARIKNIDARNAAIAALKADRPEVAKQFFGDRKEDQAERSAEKKFAKMQKAGLTEADIDDNWKYPEDCSSLEEYDSDAVSNIRSKAEDGLFDAENISEDDERDYENDADGYIASLCARVAWGTGSGNEAENKLSLEFVEKEFPGKVKVLRKYLGNNNSTVR